MTMNLPDFPPALILLLGALLVPALPGKVKSLYTILLPALAFYFIHQLEPGTVLSVSFFPNFPELELLRVDKLSKAFGYIFTLNACAGMIYAFYIKDNTEYMAALAYVGSALGVIFAGDLISLYIFWEFMAITSTFIILAHRTTESYRASMRYILAHLFGGLLLLAGILLHIHETGSSAFTHFTVQNTATWLMLLGILVNAAAPPLGSWLPDAYPSSSVVGGLILSAYTTKTAVYTLIRGFPEWEILIVIGCIMSVYGIIYALLENDMRRILAYSIINQVGFMVTAVGIGTPIALNGAVAHAFCHIIYKSLLWMSAGAVLYRVGKSKCTDLGGLYKTMPWTLLFGCIGALAISAVPLTSGFTSKTLIIAGAAKEHLFWPWLILECASAGVFLHAGIKFPYFVFFAKDKGMRTPEAPKTMLIAMAILAFLCIYLGINPQPLYNILPIEPDYTYEPYTADHIVTQLQLLTLSALVFFLFLPWLKRTATISLDTDWFYRKGGKLFYNTMDWGLNSLNAGAYRLFVKDWLVRFTSLLTSATERFTLTFARLLAGAKAPGDPAMKSTEDRLKRIVQAGAFPLGVSACLPVVFIIILMLFQLLLR